MKVDIDLLADGDILCLRFRDSKHRLEASGLRYTRQLGAGVDPLAQLEIKALKLAINTRGDVEASDAIATQLHDGLVAVHRVLGASDLLRHHRFHQLEPLLLDPERRSQLHHLLASRLQLVLGSQALFRLIQRLERGLIAFRDRKQGPDARDRRFLCQLVALQASAQRNQVLLRLCQGLLSREQLQVLVRIAQDQDYGIPRDHCAWTERAIFHAAAHLCSDVANVFWYQRARRAHLTDKRASLYRVDDDFGTRDRWRPRFEFAQRHRQHDSRDHAQGDQSVPFVFLWRVSLYVHWNGSRRFVVRHPIRLDR